MRKSFKLENLDCANCAAKMENAIRKIDGVHDATVSFMTQKMKVEFAEGAVSEIGKEGFDPVYGARPLRRAIQQRIEDKLSEQMLEGRFSPDKKYVCEYSGGDFVFETKE